jgi:hypothetical protein
VTQRFDQKIRNGVVEVTRIDRQQDTDQQGNGQKPYLGIGNLSTHSKIVLFVQLTFCIIGTNSKTLNVGAFRLIRIGYVGIVVHKEFRSEIRCTSGTGNVYAVAKIRVGIEIWWLILKIG